MAVVVLEINEIPQIVLEKYISKYPNSNLNQLKYRVTTLANDLPEEELYPSQTWASLNTGLPYNKHKVKWFSDSLDSNNLYWNKLQKLGYKTSVVGSLHTSPAPNFLKENHNFETFIPDFFSKDKETFPKSFSDFQSFNIKVTNENRRVSNLSLLKNALLAFLKQPNLKFWGLNNILALKQMLEIVFTSVFKNKERLRLAQFVMSSSILYESLKNESQLAIIFSNHIASMMHRYLHAFIDIENCPYDEKWKKKYRNEVEFSIHLLDEWIGKLISMKNKQEISLIMLSSMGQKINKKIDNEHLRKFDFDFILRDQKKFLELALAEKIPEFTPRGVMVPQYSYEFEDNLIAEEIHQKICKLGTGKNSRFGHYTKNNKLNPNLKDIYLNSDLNENVVTVSVQLNAEKIKINNKTFLYSELGFEKFKSDSHHSGEHDKRGILWSNFSLTEDKELDYLNVEELIRNNVIRKCTKNL